jgi:hypothetical protein
MNNKTPVYANYVRSLVPEYHDNPLIESLPPIWSEDEAAGMIAHFPSIDEKERMLPKEVRMHCLNRLKNVVQPLPIHLELESAISSLIRSGYVNRNPRSASTWRHLHTLSTPQRAETDFTSSASTFSLVGLSGMGKTTALDSILRNYPPIILHKKYKEQEFIHTQIVWLKVECPFDGSLSGLCHAFFRAVDRVLGQDKYAKRYKSKGGILEMIQSMEQIASTYFIGAIFIDELQHLNAAKTGGKDNMLNFFVNLINSIGIPVVFIGTNPMVQLFADVLRNARRACGLGMHDFKQPTENDPAWELLVEVIWEYQWVHHVAPLTPEIKATLYDLTQGVTDFLAKLMIMGQRYAMQSGSETLTVDLFKHVADTKMKLLKPLLAILRSKDPDKMSKFEDLMPTDDQLDAMMEESGVLVLENRLSTLRKVKNNRTTATKPEIAAESPSQKGAKAVPVVSTIAAQIHTVAIPRDALSDAGWLQDDPLEFSDLYRQQA